MVWKSREKPQARTPTAENDLLSPSVAHYGALAGLSQMKKGLRPWDHLLGWRAYRISPAWDARIFPWDL